MSDARSYACLTEGIEGERVNYRFLENGEVVESGWVPCFGMVEQRFETFQKIREFARSVG